MNGRMQIKYSRNFVSRVRLPPYPFIFITDSIPYSILNIRRVCLEIRMPSLSSKWMDSCIPKEEEELPSCIWDLAENGT